MTESGDRKRDEKGLSARYLVLVFLMGVAACAVFFSLGFLVGYNERPSKTAGLTEEVTPSGVIPPTVNPPLETIPVTSKDSEARPATEKSGDSNSSRLEKESKSPAVRAALGPDADLPPPSTPLTNNRAAPAGGGKATQVGMGFTVQVAASRDKQDAEKLVKELKSRGFAVFLVLPEYANAGDNLYRVQVGPYATREKAQEVRDRIAKEGFKPFIRR